MHRETFGASGQVLRAIGQFFDSLLFCILPSLKTFLTLRHKSTPNVKKCRNSFLLSTTSLNPLLPTQKREREREMTPYTRVRREALSVARSNEHGEDAQRRYRGTRYKEDRRDDGNKVHRHDLEYHTPPPRPEKIRGAFNVIHLTSTQATTLLQAWALYNPALQAFGRSQ